MESLGFTLTLSFWLHSGPGVDSDCNRNEYQGYLLREGGNGGRFLELTMLPPSYADHLEILGA